MTRQHFIVVRAPSTPQDAAPSREHTTSGAHAPTKKPDQGPQKTQMGTTGGGKPKGVYINASSLSLVPVLHSPHVLVGRTRTIPHIEVPEESLTEESDKDSKDSAESDDEPLIVSVEQTRSKQTTAADQQGKSLTATPRRDHDDLYGLPQMTIRAKMPAVPMDPTARTKGLTRRARLKMIFLLMTRKTTC